MIIIKIKKDWIYIMLLRHSKPFTLNSVFIHNTFTLVVVEQHV